MCSVTLSLSLTISVDSALLLSVLVGFSVLFVLVGYTDVSAVAPSAPPSAHVLLLLRRCLAIPPLPAHPARLLPWTTSRSSRGAALVKVQSSTVSSLSSKSLAATSVERDSTLVLFFSSPSPASTLFTCCCCSRIVRVLAGFRFTVNTSFASPVPVPLPPHPLTQPSLWAGSSFPLLRFHRALTSSFVSCLSLVVTAASFSIAFFLLLLALRIACAPHLACFPCRCALRCSLFYFVFFLAVAV